MIRAGSWALILFTLASSPASGQQFRAYWADAFHSGYKSPAEVDKLVEDVARSRCNAIFMQARRRADSYYRNTLEVPAQDPTYPASFDALQYLTERAHARGIEVHAWFVVYPLWPTNLAPPANPEHLWYKHGPAAPGDAMWMTMTAAGAKGASLEPGHPAVQRYLAGVILDPIARYDIDGIHLDYVRYPEDANYGWHPAAVERFQRLYNATGAPRADDPSWSNFRRRQVTEFVRQIYLRAIEKKPSIKVTAALISWGNGPATDAAFERTETFARVFQDWRAWLEEGILDIAMPMHYFREAGSSAALDQWLAFAKDRQYRRAYVAGIGAYLNDIPASLAQMTRALTPGASGRAPAGVAIYSYASTNTLDVRGEPTTPNEEFYRRAGDYFGGAATVPSLPWKASPANGHIAGTIEVTGGPDWLADGATVTASSDTGASVSRTIASDATGFFGFVDLPPDRYRLRVERNGVTVFDATPREVRAGAVTRFDVVLKAEDFAAARPRLTGARADRAAPGDVIAIAGSRLASTDAYAASVPLPMVLDGTQVVVNGVAAPLYSVAPGQLVFQVPYLEAPQWTTVVRRDGVESEPLSLPAVTARPVIVGVRRVADRFLEIYATGLGAVDPPLAEGLGADPTAGPLPMTRLPVRVRFGSSERESLYSGLVPYQPGLYQVNVEAPTTGALTVQLVAGGAVSPPVVLPGLQLAAQKQRTERRGGHSMRNIERAK